MTQRSVTETGQTSRSKRVSWGHFRLLETKEYHGDSSGILTHRSIMGIGQASGHIGVW